MQVYFGSLGLFSNVTLHLDEKLVRYLANSIFFVENIFALRKVTLTFDKKIPSQKTVAFSFTYQSREDIAHDREGERLPRGRREHAVDPVHRQQMDPNKLGHVLPDDLHLVLGDGIAAVGLLGLAAAERRPAIAGLGLGGGGGRHLRDSSRRGHHC